MKQIILLATMGLISTGYAENVDAKLSAGTQVTLSGKAARFDYMEVDNARDRLLAAHSEAGTLTVLSLETQKLISEIPVGKVQGVAVDKSTGSYVLGDSEEHKVVFVNADSLKVSAEVKVAGPVDALTRNTKNGFVYADEDDGSHVWVISETEKKVVATIDLPGVPEFIVYDSKADRVYQNIKDKDVMVVINPETNKIESTFSTLPATGPHGLAVNIESGHAFVAGKNGKLVAINTQTGKVFSYAEIKTGTDQISFDPKRKIIYCASKGFISVVQETDSGLVNVGDTVSPVGAHTIAADSNHNGAWVSYADHAHSYLKNFKNLDRDK